MLVNDFVKNFNDYHERTFSPSDMICVDESISCWHDLGGHWINLGLPMYVAIDRKPENGCEIQDSCDGRARIMLRLKLVMHEEDETKYLENLASGLEQGNTEADLGHGTKVIRELISPWIKSPGDPRTVCADSYFASVATAIELKRCGFNFIGVVKMATKQYPMNYLQNLELKGRGDYKVVPSFKNE